MQNDLLHEFCERFGIDSKNLAPHVAYVLVGYSTGPHLETLIGKINSSETKANVLAHNESLLTEIKTDYPERYQEVKDYFSKDMSEAGVKTVLFNFFHGIQVSYARTPYCPAMGIKFPDAVRGDPFECFYSQKIDSSIATIPRDGVAITPSYLRHYGLIDDTSFKSASPFHTDLIKKNMAFYAGKEEQDHSSDTKLRDIDKKETSKVVGADGKERLLYKESGLRPPELDMDIPETEKTKFYYLSNLSELTAALRQLDHICNVQKGCDVNSAEIKLAMVPRGRALEDFKSKPKEPFIR